MRENYNISEYGKGSRKKIKDRVIREKYPNATIYTLIASEKIEKSERLIDNILGFFTDLPFGIPDFIKGVKNLDKEFYLVEENGEQTMFESYAALQIADGLNNFTTAGHVIM